MGTEMTLEEHFAELAKQFRAKASTQTGRLKAEWEHLANCYTEIAGKSDQHQPRETPSRFSQPARER